GPPASRARTRSRGILSEESGAGGLHPRADFRGKGGQFPGRTGQGDGPDGRARGALQGRRRGRDRQGLIAALWRGESWDKSVKVAIRAAEACCRAIRPYL